jgi:NAD+ synthase (glutamine-hydrolysing)
MKIALVQTNPTIGDVGGNLRGILSRIDEAAAAGADLIVFPEQALLGYPAKDLLLRQEIVRSNLEALERVAAATRGRAGPAGPLGVVVGFAEPSDRPFGRPLYNSAALLIGGRIVACSRKRLLPTYDVFDEVRYFASGGPQPVVELGTWKLGISICEDMWADEELLARPLYDLDPLADLVADGASLILNISASPYYLGKHRKRIELMARHARRLAVPIAFCNQVGGNDELLFDGASCVVDRSGRLVAQARAFEEDLLLVDLRSCQPGPIAPYPDDIQSLHDALVMGLRDYVRKCGFSSVVLGLSGGVDSSVVACLAAAALGAGSVHGVAMPSRYSSPASLEDARLLSENLGIRFSVIPIEPIHQVCEQVLAPHFAGLPPDVTEENIQARIRGLILMALSNKFGSLLLTTGNKSELAVGYCTLYGDMCGGLAVIGDVPKTTVYELARHINRRAGRAIIPERALVRPPSAELRPDQTDQDTLPPYALLDEILRRYEERLETPEQIATAGIDPTVLDDVIRRIHASEYKRQQAAPGLKVTLRAFGFGRRMPIAARPFSACKPVG